MILLVDIGNSRIKWTMSCDGALSKSDGFLYDKERLVSQLIQAWAKVSQPEEVYLLAVADAYVVTTVTEWIRQQWGIAARRLETQKRCGNVTNGYHQYSQLGADRWAAIIGAYTLVQKSVCVVDSGTALTCDMVASDGRHLGGLIVPGRRLQAQVLVERAADINEKYGNGTIDKWGQDTASCISSGIMQEQVALVERCMRQLSRQQDTEVELIVTGGDAPSLITYLELPVQFEPDLVFKGMLGMAAG